MCLRSEASSSANPSLNSPRPRTEALSSSLGLTSSTSLSKSRICNVSNDLAASLIALAQSIRSPSRTRRFLALSVLVAELATSAASASSTSAMRLSLAPVDGS